MRPSLLLSIFDEMSSFSELRAPYFPGMFNKFTRLHWENDKGIEECLYAYQGTGARPTLDDKGVWHMFPKEDHWLPNISLEVRCSSCPLRKAILSHTITNRTSSCKKVYKGVVKAFIRCLHANVLCGLFQLQHHNDHNNLHFPPVCRSLIRSMSRDLKCLSTIWSTAQTFKMCLVCNSRLGRRQSYWYRCLRCPVYQGRYSAFIIRVAQNMHGNNQSTPNLLPII